MHPAPPARGPAAGGGASPEPQRSLSRHPPGAGETRRRGPRPSTCGAVGPLGAAAGSEARSGVRRQPQVPREQAQEVEDDAGFVTPRRVLDAGEQTERG